MMPKRSLDIAVISDAHLGTYGCHAKELYTYLRSIDPEILILNGDIIDIWAFNKNYFPKYHLKVIKELFRIAAKGTTIFYLTGNHDDALRKFSGTRIKNIRIEDKLVLKRGRIKMLFFHGDIFDSSIGNTRWLAKIGGKGYDYLILLNRFINNTLSIFGCEKISFSKVIKNSVKKAVSLINDFEVSAAELAIKSNCQYVVCGHIHSPQIRTIKNKNGKVIYLNSGDWVENLTALEYSERQWNIYRHVENIDQSILPEESSKAPKTSLTDLVGIFSNEVITSEPTNYAHLIRDTRNRTRAQKSS